MVDAMEKDLLTARITQALHPYGKDNIFVRQEPFEAIGELEDKDKYDLITSNIPFGDFMVYDRSYSKGENILKRESTRTIHNYFFVKGLDTIKEGGLLAFITSQGVLDSPKNEAIRRYLMQNSRLISAIRLPSGMFSENAGTDVGSDLIVLQKQSGKEIGEGIEQQFVQTASVPKGDGFSIAFNHNSLFEGEWKDISHRTIATDRQMGTDPYGKPAWEYTFDGSIEDMADNLRTQLSLEVEQRFDRKLYETGIPMTREEWQVQVDKMEQKVQGGLKTEQTPLLQESKEKENKEEDNAYNLMPESTKKQLPKLYATEKQLIGDRTAYARYFFPMGAYTAYLLEYDPKERIGFGAVTMGYGWELGYMSLKEMEEVKVKGLGIERDLYFKPTKLHEIAELEEIVRGQYTKEPIIEEVKEERSQEVLRPVQEGTQPQENIEEGNKIVGDEAKDEAETKKEAQAAQVLPTIEPEKESREIRTDVEAPREMNGQTVFFDEDHHPIMDSTIETETTEQLLFAPEEYSLWTQDVARVNNEIKEAAQQKKVSDNQPLSASRQPKSTRSTPTSPRRSKKTASAPVREPSLFDFMEESEPRKPQPIAEVKKEFDASPRPFLSSPDSHLRDGSIVVQKGQVGDSMIMRRTIKQRTRKSVRNSIGFMTAMWVVGDALTRRQTPILLRWMPPEWRCCFWNAPRTASTSRRISSTIQRLSPPPNCPLPQTRWRHWAHHSTSTVRWNLII